MTKIVGLQSFAYSTSVYHIHTEENFMSKDFIRNDGNDYCIIQSVDVVDHVTWVSFEDHNGILHALPATQFYSEYHAVA